jgi:hypothetical protein
MHFLTLFVKESIGEDNLRRNRLPSSARAIVRVTGAVFGGAGGLDKNLILRLN